MRKTDGKLVRHPAIYRGHQNNRPHLALADTNVRFASKESAKASWTLRCDIRQLLQQLRHPGARCCSCASPCCTCTKPLHFPMSDMLLFDRAGVARSKNHRDVASKSPSHYIYDDDASVALPTCRHVNFFCRAQKQSLKSSRRLLVY